MKTNILRFLKVFSVTLFISCLIIAIGVFSYLRIFNPLDTLASDSIDSNYIGDLEEELKNDAPLEKAIKESKRINVLIVGLEHVRTDTIMLASFDRVTKEGNIISIPRDTFVDRKGYKNIGSKRINAIYQSENIEGLISAVEKIFKFPIHRYVTVDYQAVVAGVDALGGVEVDIPIRMYYTDPSDVPPLVIDFQPGPKLLDGKDAIKYLRFRKNDDGTSYPRMDIDRIVAQQDFVKRAVKKMLSFKLNKLISDVYPYVKTDFSLTELISLGVDSIGFSPDNLSTEVLPGGEEKVEGASLYFPDYGKALEYTYKLYKVIE